MNSNTNETNILIKGKQHKKHVLLADVNLPYKLSIDRKNNNLFFCINADEFSDQSFQIGVLNLATGSVSIIPGIYNGYATAVNQSTGEVFIGGSDGIYKYNYKTKDVDPRKLINGIDIFDMYFYDHIYFVDTGTQNLHYLNQYRKDCIVSNLKGNLIQHFVFDINNDLYFVNYAGVFVLTRGNKSPTLLGCNINIRGAATDANGLPFFVAKDGIYEIDKISKHLSKVLSLENGYGLAFNRDNNIIYSEERSIIALIPS